jgi:photosystem II stability/assembly factor-like uncharacterized protein
VAGLTVLDSTWVSDLTGWVLGAAQCSGTPCRVIFHTADGGRSWDQIAAPPPPATSVSCDQCVDHLRFADARIGYAYAIQLDKQAALFVTTDGGQTWRQDPAPTVIEGLEISGRTAVRLVADGSGCPGACNVRLESSAVGSSVWHRLPAPNVSEGKGDGLVVQGSRIYYLGLGNPAGGVIATTRIARSLDAGATWRTFDDPCGSAGVDARDFAAAPGGFLAVLCVPQGSQTPPFEISSSDAGTTYGSPHPLPVPTGSAELGLAAGSANNLAAMVFAGVTPTVVVSDNGGSSWRATLSGPAFSNGGIQPGFLGFEDAKTARVAFPTGPLWTTRNGGDSWQPSDIAAGV